MSLNEKNRPPETDAEIQERLANEKKIEGFSAQVQGLADLANSKKLAEAGSPGLREAIGKILREGGLSIDDCTERILKICAKGDAPAAPAPLPENIQRIVDGIIAVPDTYRGYALILAKWVKSGGRGTALVSPMDDAQKGLYRKYEVRRTNGSSEAGGKHEHCRYFVLDLDHDAHAAPALRAYADSCEAGFPALAADLRKLAPATPAAPPQAKYEPYTGLHQPTCPYFSHEAAKGNGFADCDCAEDYVPPAAQALVCVCGHLKSDHRSGDADCREREKWCECTFFEGAAQAPAARTVWITEDAKTGQLMAMSWEKPSEWVSDNPAFHVIRYEATHNPGENPK